MSFKLVKGKSKLVAMPFTASVALAKDTLIEFSSGYAAAADDNEAAADIRGVLAEDITATDADYATTGKLKLVRVPLERHCEWEADTADTFVQATHGGVECGIIDNANVDLDDTTNDAFLALRPGSSSLKVVGYLKINGAY